MKDAQCAETNEKSNFRLTDQIRTKMMFISEDATANWGLAKNLEGIFVNLIQNLTSEERILNQ